MVNYCKLCGADLTPTKELKLMTWEDFVKKTKKYGYKEHINVFGDGSVWKGVKRGKYSNGEDIIAYSPIFTKEGKILFSEIFYKENVSYEKMLKIIDAIESEE